MAEYKFRTTQTRVSEHVIKASTYPEAEEEYRNIHMYSPQTLHWVIVDEETEITEDEVGECGRD